MYQKNVAKCLNILYLHLSMDWIGLDLLAGIVSWYDDVSPFLFDFPSPQIVTQGSYKYFFGLEKSLILCQDL